MYFFYSLKSEVLILKIDNSWKRIKKGTQCWYRELSIDTEGSFCEKSLKSESEDASFEKGRESNSESVITEDSERDQDEKWATAD